VSLDTMAGQREAGGIITGWGLGNHAFQREGGAREKPPEYSGERRGPPRPEPSYKKGYQIRTGSKNVLQDPRHRRRAREGINGRKMLGNQNDTHGIAPLQLKKAKKPPKAWKRVVVARVGVFKHKKKEWGVGTVWERTGQKRDSPATAPRTCTVNGEEKNCRKLLLVVFNERDGDSAVHKYRRRGRERNNNNLGKEGKRSIGDKRCTPVSRERKLERSLRIRKKGGINQGVKTSCLMRECEGGVIHPSGESTTRASILAHKWGKKRRKTTTPKGSAFGTFIGPSRGVRRILAISAYSQRTACTDRGKRRKRRRRSTNEGSA